ncbi:hypothetical protein COCON_G00115600 [Conger conger]|uniref:Uncharacterized protein n=1 Tax=Conger conger TaxID=82655 RepID=A0A9Q1DFV9_CONCO|nr:hypothetical protein COCON_G00115600 [Conger conger]
MAHGSALSTTRSSQESKVRLLQDAKRFTAELERQREELEKMERFPEGSNTEVGKMRRQLLIYHNKIRQAHEQEYQLQFQMECLLGEKDILEKEYNRQPKPAEQEKKAKVLRDGCEELRKEVAQRRMEIKSLKEDMDTKQKNLQREKEALDQKKDTIENLEADLAQLLCVPGQLGKEIDRIKRKKTDVQKKTAELVQKKTAGQEGGAGGGAEGDLAVATATAVGERAAACRRSASAALEGRSSSAASAQCSPRAAA